MSRRNAFRPSSEARREFPIRRSGRQARLVRTIVLGALAVVAGLGWLTVELGMDPDELTGYALTSLLLVAGAVLVALAGAGLLVGLRQLRRRRERRGRLRGDR